MATFTSRLALGVAFAAVLAGTGAAQDFPSHPITMIVPFAAGGLNDTIGRIVTDRMRMSLGQPVIIENQGGGDKPGAKAHEHPPACYLAGISVTFT